MSRFFIKTSQIEENTIKILGEDVKHIKNVLRKENGQIIEVCNQEDGKIYECKIVQLLEQEIICNIEKCIKKQGSKIIVDIYQGLPKADKMELIIQKSVELGANSIIPVQMKRSIVKIDKKNENRKIERWQKISESAAKQSKRNIIPKIENVVTIQDIIKSKNKYNLIIVAYEEEQDNYIKNEISKIKEQIKEQEKMQIGIVIGPEGGLEKEEVQELKNNGAKIVTLGKRILRTETVALNILSIIMYEFEK
ncbi:MAG: 16S rRNA (uracil(1498)-N(3))-methyltransferase [Clostridia bacterium]|nr:16S rRNA (uracil(1498)-N(3))-methyltransferase [Clostridia bacterium]